MIKKHQIIKIHSLLPVAIKEDPDDKKALISEFTGDVKKSSTKDLSELQADELIFFLKHGKLPSAQPYAYFDKSNKQHLYILSLSIQLGWKEIKKGRTIADLNRLGAWLKSTGYLKKPLKSYTPIELQKLVYQFERVVGNSFK